MSSSQYRPGRQGLEDRVDQDLRHLRRRRLPHQALLEARCPREGDRMDQTVALEVVMDLGAYPHLRLHLAAWIQLLWLFPLRRRRPTRSWRRRRPVQQNHCQLHLPHLPYPRQQGRSPRLQLPPQARDPQQSLTKLLLLLLLRLPALPRLAECLQLPLWGGRLHKAGPAAR